MFCGKFNGIGRKRTANMRDGEYFCTSISDNIIIYGLFAECNDKIASKYAAKHLPLEFLNLWKEQVENPNIEMMLIKVFEIIENRLLQYHVGMKVDGTSALVVVIHGKELFIAHTGCDRVLMFAKQDNVTYINQLVMEHNLKNSKELKRLNDLGLDRSHLTSENFLGYPFTRCLGNMHLKKFYGSIPALSNLKSSPWIAVPDVAGSIKITDGCLMLVMVCSGILNYFSDAGYQMNEINSEIISRINGQIPLQPTLNDVAQTVVDEIIFSSHSSKRGFPRDIDSLTLMIHCFQNFFTMPSSNDQFLLSHNCLDPLTIDVGQDDYSNSQMRSYLSPHSTKHDTIRSACDTFSKSPSKSSQLPLGEDGRLEPYVDFSYYFAAIDKLATDHKLDNNPDFRALMEFEKLSRDIINS